MLDLLSRQWHQDGSKKDKDSPLKTSSSETGFHVRNG